MDAKVSEPASLDYSVYADWVKEYGEALSHIRPCGYFDEHQRGMSPLEVSWDPRAHKQPQGLGTLPVTSHLRFSRRITLVWRSESTNAAYLSRGRRLLMQNVVSATEATPQRPYTTFWVMVTPQQLEIGYSGKRKSPVLSIDIFCMAVADPADVETLRSTMKDRLLMDYDEHTGPFRRKRSTAFSDFCNTIASRIACATTSNTLDAGMSQYNNHGTHCAGGFSPSTAADPCIRWRHRCEPTEVKLRKYLYAADDKADVYVATCDPTAKQTRPTMTPTVFPSVATLTSVLGTGWAATITPGNVLARVGPAP
ncbi:MAG: hypothetical protein JKY23_04315 [Nitrospinaceae bacterium]|nr:hypothetical protein [Nitrospinaceae bacterium]